MSVCLFCLESGAVMIAKHNFEQLYPSIIMTQHIHSKTAWSFKQLSRAIIKPRLILCSGNVITTFAKTNIDMNRPIRMAQRKSVRGNFINNLQNNPFNVDVVQSVP